MREHRWTHEHLSDYLDAELSEAERRRVEEHTTLCPECRRVLATLRRTVAALRGSAGRRGSAAGIEDAVIERLRREG